MRTSLLLFATTVSAAIQWKNCTSSQVSIAGPGLQCAELSVPVNWTDPHSQNITIGLTRLKAANSTKRIGNLVFSPGGPAQPSSPILGGQSLGFPLFPENITTAFDLIGFDVRGAGPISKPITCDPKIFNQRTSYYPTSEAEYDAIVSANKARWGNCANLTGPLLYNADSRSVAHDLEALRVALNDGPLNFLGISYSTVATQTYAQLYPHNFRTLTMDAVINHSASGTALFFDEAQAFENSLERFAEWCSSVNTTICPLSGQDVLSIYNKTVSDAFTTSLPAPGCNGTLQSISTTAGQCLPNITGSEIISVTQNLLLFKNPEEPITAGWPGLARALSLAIKGNATALSLNYASSNFASSNNSNVFAAQALPCLDYPDTLPSYSDVQYRLALGSQVAPLTRGLSFKWRQQVQCIGFPRPATYPPRDTGTEEGGAKPVLITQSKWDPNAAFLWAEMSREAIRNSSLVVREGDGHTSAFLNGETARVIWDYFISAKIPRQNLVVST